MPPLSELKVKRLMPPSSKHSIAFWLGALILLATGLATSFNVYREAHHTFQTAFFTCDADWQQHVSVWFAFGVALSALSLTVAFGLMRRSRNQLSPTPQPPSPSHSSVTAFSKKPLRKGLWILAIGALLTTSTGIGYLVFRHQMIPSMAHRNQLTEVPPNRLSRHGLAGWAFVARHAFGLELGRVPYCSQNRSVPVLCHMDRTTYALTRDLESDLHWYQSTDAVRELELEIERYEDRLRRGVRPAAQELIRAIIHEATLYPEASFGVDLPVSWDSDTSTEAQQELIATLFTEAIALLTDGELVRLRGAEQTYTLRAIEPARWERSTESALCLTLGLPTGGPIPTSNRVKCAEVPWRWHTPGPVNASDQHQPSAAEQTKQIDLGEFFTTLFEPEFWTPPTGSRRAVHVEVLAGPEAKPLR